MKFTKKTILKAAVGIGILLVLVPVLSLSASHIETTENRVHKRLLVSLGPMGSLGIPMYAGTGDRVVLPGFLDGPIVKLEGQGRWSASWFCEDRAQKRSGNEATLVIDCAGKQSRYTLNAQAGSPPSVVPMPPKLLVLSDIEGNIAFLDKSLRHLEVVDEQGNWRYGANRLVIAGDAVDRGRDVFAVLWRLHELSLQAKAAGGAVHMLLGNHEQYLLQGNVSRAHHEHLYALEQMGGQAQAFGADTLLGKWLREQGVVLQAGKVLITHGGISAKVAAEKLSLTQLNDAMRRYWQAAPATTAELDSVIGRAGVSQYRGYFEAASEQYEKATQAEVNAVLAAFGAEAIVVGHTQVEKVTPLFDQRVYAINVNSNGAAAEALLFENGVAKVVDAGTGRNLPSETASRPRRPLNVLATEDWRILGLSARRSYALSSLPFPY
jgi:hypothetical protein